MTEKEEAVPATKRLNFGKGSAPLSSAPASPVPVESATSTVVAGAEQDGWERAKSENPEGAAAMEAIIDEPLPGEEYIDELHPLGLDSETAAMEAQEAHNDLANQDPSDEVVEAVGELSPETLVETAQEAETLQEPVQESPEAATATETVHRSTVDPSIEELQDQQEALARQIEDKRVAEKASVMSQIKTVVNTYRIPVEELFEFLGGVHRRKGTKATQKYRDPASKATWSGRGKEPAWIKGQDRTKFLIVDEAG